MTTANSFITGTEAAITTHAAALVISEAWRAVSSRRQFSLVLAGGHTPRQLYRKLSAGISPEIMMLHDIPPAGTPRQDGLIRIPWHETLIFWGDERCVPPDHPDSNYRMAKETLLGSPGIHDNRVFRMNGELRPAEKGAEIYEKTIRAALGPEIMATSHNEPVFDLMILGLGEDGHTASLFPGDQDTLDESHRLVVAVKTPETPPRVPRMTMSLPLINRTRTVLFYTEGTRRLKLARAIAERKAPCNLPACRVQPASKRIFWFISLP